eukprot:7129527-Lingulodinium_polyedra.AAC.1
MKAPEAPWLNPRGKKVAVTPREVALSAVTCRARALGGGRRVPFFPAQEQGGGDDEDDDF